MGGIAGIWHWSGRPIDVSKLDALASNLYNRGADDCGKFIQHPLALICRRLAIIDHSSSSQPITSQDGRFTIVGNGTIYNHSTLRQELLSENTKFWTNDNFEVALYCFARFNWHCFSRFRGPFAIAIWDSQENTLWLARDRWGERPLYLIVTDSAICFSSTIRSLGEISDSKLTPNIEAVANFLGAGLMASGQTCIMEIESVDPGQVLKIQSERVDRFRYWDWEDDLKVEHNKEDFEKTLAHAINRTFISDRPLALAFSGGVDSTAILREAIDNHVNIIPFTLTTSKQDQNRVRAYAVGRELGIQTVDVPFFMPCLSEVEYILRRRLDSPAPQPTVIHNDRLHRKVSSIASVMIGGYGGDEVLGGYNRYVIANAAFGSSNSRNGLRQAHGWKISLHLIYEACNGTWPRMGTLLNWIANTSALIRPQYQSLIRPCSLMSRAQHVLSHEFEGTPTDIMQVLDFLVLNSHENFILPDENGMAHSLEVRAPFLDHDLVSFCFSIAAQDRLLNGVSKGLLKEILKRTVCSKIAMADKIGFADDILYSSWFRDKKQQVRTKLVDLHVYKCTPLLEVEVEKIMKNDGYFDENWEFVWRLFAYCVWADECTQFLAVEMN